MLRLGLVFTSDTTQAQALDKEQTVLFFSKLVGAQCVPAFMLESVVKVRPSVTIFYHTIIKSI